MAFTDGPPPAGGEAHEAAPRPVEEAVASLVAAERTLAAVDWALEALDRNAYGTCAVCATAIADEDLADDPTVTHCRQHRATR